MIDVSKFFTDGPKIKHTTKSYTDSVLSISRRKQHQLLIIQ